MARIGRLIACSTLLLAACDTALADETYRLTPVLKPQTLSHVQMTLEAGGKLRVTESEEAEEAEELEMQVESAFVYDEMFLAIDPTAAQSLRYYTRAEAKLQINDKLVEPTLRDEVRLIATDANESAATSFSPAAPLNRDELDLVTLPANTLLLDRLLPSEEVALRQTWSHDNRLMAALLGLDTVGASNAASVLTEITEEAAKCQLAGTVNGALTGVATEMQIKAKYTYDRKLGRITWFAMALQEIRGPGYVNSGIDATAKLQIKITPIETSQHLTAERLAGVDAAATPENTQLLVAPQHDAFRLISDRRWHSVSESPGHVALRLIDRGELLAQCNVRVPAKVAPQALPSLSQFQDEIRKALGDKFTQFVRAAETGEPGGLKAYRVAAHGAVSDLPIEWRYYLLMAPDGGQVSLAFTVEQALAERLAEADQELVAGVQIIAKVAETAAAPNAETTAK